MQIDERRWSVGQKDTLPAHLHDESHLSSMSVVKKTLQFTKATQ